MRSKGYLIAKELKHAGDARLLTAYGTLYRALGRLERMGLLASRWEDPQIPRQEHRPGRRLYELTATGEAAVASGRAQAAVALKKGWAPTRPVSTR